MKRILQVIPDMDLNGIAMFNMNHLQNLKDSCRYDFMVFQEVESPLTAEVESLGGHIYCSGTTSVRRIFSFMKRAVSIIKEHGPYDVVHSHVNFAGSWVMLAAAIAGVPVRVAHSHGMGAKEGSSGLGRLYLELPLILMKLCSTHMLACGEAAGEYQFGRRRFQKHGVVIPNGIDSARFACVPEEEARAVRNEWDIPEDCPLVVENISRFSADKNTLFSVEVFAEILKREPRAVLVLGGPDWGLLEAVRARIEELGIKEQVRLLGRRSDMPACLKAADVFLFPSPTEGLGIALLEAQAAGCFCVASTGVPREADMGLGGLLYEELTHSPEYWAERILEGCRTWERPCAQMVYEAFSARGYESRAASRKLAEIYGVRPDADT